MQKRSFILLVVPVLLLSACGKKGVTVGDDEGIGTEVFQFTMPAGGGPLEHPTHGKELWLAVGPMAGVEGTNANGVTQAQYFEDGLYVHSLALNIEQAPDGFFYEAWAVPASGSPVSLGHLTTPFGDVRHRVSFEEKQDLRSAMKIMVTLEKDDGNPAPAQTVAEGTLKERTRK